MAINKTYPGPQIVSKRMIVTDAFIADGFGPTYGVTQPANSVVESVFIRVLEAPEIATGCSIGFEAGTDADIDNVIDQSGDADGSDNILDAASDDPATIPVGTIYKIDENASAHFGFVTRDFATGDAATEGASEIVTEDTQLKFRFRLSNHAVTTQGKFEVSFVFRGFE